MDGGCCRGVPAALLPVQAGPNGPCVTVCVACAAPGPAADVSSTSCACEGVPRHINAICLDACAAATALTARCSLVRQEASRSRPASTTRSTRSSLARWPSGQRAGARPLVGSCGRHGRMWARRPLCWCCACACMALPCCMCFVCMLPVDTVGREAPS